MRITSFLLGLLAMSSLLSQTVFAQDWNNYQVLRASGDIPLDFTQKSAERYKEAAAQNKETEADRQTRKAKDEFYLKSSYGLADILLSGKILFGDPVTNYINKVADKLLAKQPELRKQLRFYTVKSAAVNAFATNEGVICINLGLLARVENEAQLAYILAHEITHYVKKHSVEGYIFSKTVEKEKGAFKNSSDLEKRLANSNFSQENETEADTEGLKTFLATDYDWKQALTAFDLLENASLPYEKLSFLPTALNGNYVNLPENFFEVDTLIIAKKDTVKKAIEELFSSHPDPQARKASIEKILKDSGKGAALYLTSKEEFETARQYARFDLCDLFIIRGNYIDALYQTLLLKKDFANNQYLDFCMAKALYGIAKYQIHGQKIYYLLNYDEVNWNKKNWFFALEDLSEKELAILAASYLQTLKTKYPDDDYLKKALSDLSGDMKYYLELPITADEKKKVAEEKAKKAEEKKKQAEEAKKKAEADAKAKAEADNKRKALDAQRRSVKTSKDKEKEKVTEKAKKDQEEEDKEEEKSKEKTSKEETVRRLDSALVATFDQAWEKLSSDAEFAKAAEAEAKVIASRKKALENRKVKNMAQAMKYYESVAERKKYGYRLGLNKIILLNPLAMKVDETKSKDKAVDYLGGDALYQRMNKEVKTQAKNLGLEVRVLDGQELSTAKSAELLTQVAIIREWYSEEMRHIMPAINSRQDDVDALVEKLGTSKVAFMGVIDYKGKKKGGDFLKLIPSLVYPPLLWQVVRPNKNTLVYTFVFDLKDTKILMEDYVAMQFATSDATLAQNIYFQLYQIKQNKK